MNRYTTIMSYVSADCYVTRVNYFANPDVSYLDQPTGSDTENCARAIQENRVGRLLFFQREPMESLRRVPMGANALSWEPDPIMKLCGDLL